MSRTFTQAKYQSVGGVSMANAGCGPCSVASIVSNVKESITPRTVARWLIDNGYFSSSGTTRTGISKALNHYGMQCLYFTPEHSGNDEWDLAFDMLKLSREHRLWAILLVVGTKNGGKDNLWTNGGHFIAITDYDPKTGKVYVRDSGSRGRTGYYDPSTLKYDTNARWVVTETF
jgi:hypothetical protein